VNGAPDGDRGPESPALKGGPGPLREKPRERGSRNAGNAFDQQDAQRAWRQALESSCAAEEEAGEV